LLITLDLDAAQTFLGQILWVINVNDIFIIVVFVFCSLDSRSAIFLAELLLRRLLLESQKL